MVQLTWPHKDTDWAPILPEITAVYEEMAREISKRRGGARRHAAALNRKL